MLSNVIIILFLIKLRCIIEVHSLTCSLCWYVCSWQAKCSLWLWGRLCVRLHQYSARLHVLAAHDRRRSQPFPHSSTGRKQSQQRYAYLLQFQFWTRAWYFCADGITVVESRVVRCVTSMFSLWSVFVFEVAVWFRALEANHDEEIV